GRGGNVPDTDAHARTAGARRRDRGHPRGLVRLVGTAPESGGGVMSLWSAVLLAACICVALKAFGYLIPAHLLEAPRPARISDLLTVALLAALVGVQTLGDGQAVVVDARIPAVLVAAGVLGRKSVV